MINLFYSETLAELVSLCLKKSWFQDWWKISSLVPVLENVEEKIFGKKYHLVMLLFIVSKILESFVIISWLTTQKDAIFFQIFMENFQEVMFYGLLR